jgi:hypothetical protein
LELENEDHGEAKKLIKGASAPEGKRKKRVDAFMSDFVYAHLRQIVR